MGMALPNIGSLSILIAAFAPPSTARSSSSADDASKKIRKLSKMQQFIKRPDSLFLIWNDSSFVIHSINHTSDADMEDYVFEYSEEEPEEQDVDTENQYYNSKGTELPL
ncbi:hypothetical protein L1987_41899 [Smallanthus sonchifolius]|uniref:Uncharacterized protein n=1 Tax=Smallanthus sonchifolius TaxID=185202 RepID=A0ACB9GWN7_9ASTR|nr:hypothetical protein L1987_41899 [Smallanthus sonchifolius]